MFIFNSMLGYLSNRKVTMIILTQIVDLTIYSRTFGINLWDLAWSTDILVGLVCHIASFLYFRRKVFSFLVLGMTLCSILIWWPAMMFSKSLITIHRPILKDNYTIFQDITDSDSPDKYFLTVGVYKEIYPLLYRYHGRKVELFSEKENLETLSLFNRKMYTIRENGKTLSYGKLIVPLK